MTQVKDVKLEPLFLSNYADAYRHLADYEDAPNNLKLSRALLDKALALPESKREPAQRGEIMFKFGQIDVTIGHSEDNADTRLGMREIACAYDIFEKADRGDQVRMILDTLRSFHREILRSAIGANTPVIANCSWDAESILSRL